VETASATVKQQNLPAPQASTASEVVNKNSAKAGVKQATVAESNKSAKAGKKQQGISHYQLATTILYCCLWCIYLSARLGIFYFFLN